PHSLTKLTSRKICKLTRLPHIATHLNKSIAPNRYSREFLPRLELVVMVLKHSAAAFGAQTQPIGASCNLQKAVVAKCRGLTAEGWCSDKHGGPPFRRTAKYVYVGTAAL